MQKGIHQHFVGCVQHQRTAATRLYRIISQRKTAEGIHVRLRKGQTTARAEKIQRRIRIRKPLRITQCQTDRNPHIRHAHLTDHRIVRKLHRRVQNALRVHQHLDLICRHIEQLHDQLPARHQRLLVGECNILACQNRVIGRFQPAHSHQRVHHHVTVRGRRRDQALPAMQERDLRKLRRQRERVLSPLGNRKLRTKRRDLLRQKRGIPAAGQRRHAKTIGIGRDDL